MDLGGEGRQELPVPPGYEHRGQPEPLRLITASLYGGDRETRIQQEIVLGVGGVRALRALGIKAACMHMNEGHSAFLGLERIRQLMKENSLTFEQAWPLVWSTSVFTTHTPVPAGNERFLTRDHGEILRRHGGRAGAFLEGFPRLGQGGSRQRRPRSSASPCSRCACPRTTTGSAACTAGLAQDVAPHLAVAAPGRGAHHAHHQRRASPHVDHARHDRPAGPLSRTRVPRRADQSRHLGQDRPGLRRGAVAHARAAAGEAWWPLPACGCSSSWSGAASPTRSSPAARTRFPRPRSPSASPAASPRTSAPTCSSRIPTGS